MQQLAEGGLLIFKLPTELPRLLDDPSRVRVFGATSEVNATSTQLYKEEDINCFEPQRFDCEEVTGEHLLLIVTQERVPGVFRRR
jgi:hypothetical protein